MKRWRARSRAIPLCIGAALAASIANSPRDAYGGTPGAEANAACDGKTADALFHDGYEISEKTPTPELRQKALSLFRNAYDCGHGLTKALRGMGLEEAGLGMKGAAYKHLTEWLKRPDRNRKHDAEDTPRVEALAKEVSRAEILNGAVTKVILDGEDIGPDSLFWVLPGHHTIEAWKPNGEHQTWERDAKAGHDIEPPLKFDAAEVRASAPAIVAGAESTPQKLAPGSPAPAEASVFTTPHIPGPTASAVQREPSHEGQQHATVQTDSRPHDNTRVIVGSVLLAGTAGLLATGIGFEVAATSNKNAASALLAGHTVPSSGCYGQTSSSCASAASKWSAHNTDAVLGTASFIGAGVAAAFGVATFAGVFSPKAKKDEEPPRAPTAVVPLLAPNVAGVSILGQF